MKTRSAEESLQCQPVANQLRLLLVQLLEKTGATLEPIGRFAGGREVVMELEVDDRLSYLLVRHRKPRLDRCIHLSPREQEIVALVAKGLPNKIIADALEISPWTVSTHLRRIFSKMNVGCRAEMVACALRTDLLREGLVAPTD